MQHWTFSVNPFDLLFLVTISGGLLFAGLLFWVRRLNRRANRFLALVLLVMSGWMCWVLAIDIHLGRYFPHWSWLPLQFSLAIGPLIFFYVRLLLGHTRKLKPKDLWHFLPLLAEQAGLIAEITESRRTGAATYNTAAFAAISPALQLLALVSVLAYLGLSIRLLRNYHRRLQEQFSDAERYQYRWLQRLLTGFGVLWLLWAPFTAIDFFAYQYGLGIASYYPLYLLLSAMTIWIGAEAFLRPEVILVEVPQSKPSFVPAQASAEVMRQLGWLEAQLAANLFYLNAGLTLRGLAEELEIHPNELSRIINTGTGKNFNDFINTYRVNDVMRKIQDPAYDHITLLGIAFDCGFNSKTTFNRTFKQLTGKSPAEYKSALKTATIL